MIGQTLSHYEVLERIGEGGMGVVYKARDTLLGRLVALKTLPAGGPADPDRRARLLREARAASALHHPNIVAVHDLLHHDGSDVIVMELVTGRTLDRAAAGKRLREVLGYARQIADALARAHAAGIVHRDLKPSNVMVDENGTVRVLDFGLARVAASVGTIDLGSASARTTAAATGTAEGRIVGTLAYMSPEQAEGKRADACSDVFSFGAVLYEMVTGRMAFRGDSAAATLAAVLERDLQPPRELVPGLPQDLEKLIQRCLRKDPARRFQSMGDVALDLDDIVVSLDGRHPPAARPGTSRRVLFWLTAAVVLVSLVGVLLRRAPARSSALPKLSRLTYYPGREFSPSFSPDGTQLAFVWDGEGRDNWDIYVKLVGSSGPPLRLTTDPAHDGRPAWSPDGRQIAFWRHTRLAGPLGASEWSHAILIMPALGGPARRVTEISGAGPCGLSWTPDGRWLAAPVGDPAVGNGIFLFPVDQGEKRRLTSNPSFLDTCPTLSWDGRFLAYASCASLYSCGVNVLELDAGFRPKGPATRLAGGPINITGIAWTPDGQGLVYAGVTGYISRLYRIPLQGTAQPERIELAPESARYPAVSRTREALAFSSAPLDPDIWALREGRAPAPLLASTRADTDPALSPDGKRLAFASYPPTDARRLFVSNADGTDPVQLSDGPGVAEGSPAWSPDACSIAFDSQGQDGTFHVFVIDAAGGPARRLTTDPSNEHRPSWSRDGHWIYFASDRSGRFEDYRVPAAGGEAVQVTDAGGFTCFESFDGRTLYYLKGRGSPQPLYARRLGGGAETEVVDQVYSRFFAVAEDGLYYFAPPDAAGVFALRHFDVSRGKTRELARIDAPPGLGLTVSPDRKTVLFTQVKPMNDDLMLIENFR